MYTVKRRSASQALSSVCATAYIALTQLLTNVNAVEVVGSEGGVAFGALPLARVVARLDALEAEDVEALGQYSVLHPGVAAWTR